LSRSAGEPGTQAEKDPGSQRSPRPMTPQQAASFLGLDDKTITRWARKRYLPAHPMGEGKKKYWRFFEHELLAWLLGRSDLAVAA
jgi:excisionase family DNA binding protein